MNMKLTSRSLIGVGGVCLLLWASSWVWMFGVSLPVSLSGHRADVGANSGHSYIVCFNSERFAWPFVYAHAPNGQRPSSTGAPGHWQRTVPILWIAVALCSVGGVLLINGCFCTKGRVERVTLRVLGR